jgi:hypothetical protein
MKQRFSTDIIRAAIVIVAIAIGSMCLIPGKSGNSGATASARGETGTLVLAQYNPCPGGKCR